MGFVFIKNNIYVTHDVLAMHICIQKAKMYFVFSMTQRIEIRQVLKSY